LELGLFSFDDAIIHADRDHGGWCSGWGCVMNGVRFRASSPGLRRRRLENESPEPPGKVALIPDEAPGVDAAGRRRLAGRRQAATTASRCTPPTAMPSGQPCGN